MQVFISYWIDGTKSISNTIISSEDTEIDDHRILEWEAELRDFEKLPCHIITWKVL